MNKRTKKLLAMMAAPPRLRRVSGLPPLSYTAKKAGFLTDYRIYGQTSRNLFDMKTFAETCYPRSATVNYTNNTLTFTAIAVDAYVNTAYFTGATVAEEYRSSCIDVLPATTYTISMSSAPKCYISWIGNSFEVVSAYTLIPANQSSYTFTTPEDCTKLLVRLGKEVNNIGDEFTISNIMLNSGSTPLPYEPYGESVGDRTGNLFDKNGVWVNGYINDNGELAENIGIATYTKFINVKPDTVYSLICDSSVPEGVRFNFYDSSKNFISRIFRNMQNPKVTTPSTCEYITLSVNKNQIRYLMIIEGSTAPTEYEPYGYKVPVTVSNGTDTLTTPIYLPEQIKKVGDEAEYIDYGEQKFHRISGADLDVTLPALPTLAGTNVLSVGTEVQPSLVEVTGRIRPVPTGGGE